MSARQKGLTATRWGGLRRVVAGVALTALAVGGLSAMTIASPQAADAAQSPSQQWPTRVAGNTQGGGTAAWTFGTTGVTATTTATAPNGALAWPVGGGFGTGANAFLSPDAPAGTGGMAQAVQAGQSITSTTTFNKPVINPEFHVNNMDGSVGLLLATKTDGTTAALTRVAGNNRFTLNANNQFASPAKQAANGNCENNDGSNPAGACGSIRMNGLINSFRVGNSDQGLAGDAWLWTTSFPTAPLTKQFTPGAINPGGTSELTFTIANPANEAQTALTPLGFTDTLPDGVTLKDTTFTDNGQCGTPTQTGLTAGGKTVTAGNISVAVGSTCTITVNVTASQLGTYTNDNSNLSTTVANLVPNANTSLTVTTAEIPTVTCTTDPVIFNTGYNAATDGQMPNGAADPRWTVAGGITGLNYVNTTTFPTETSSPAELPPAGTTYAPAQAGKVNNLWANSQSGKSQWISANYVDPSNGQNQADGYGDWYYRYQFNLDPAVDPSTFQLDMSWLSDNTVAGVWVNNQAQTGDNLPQDPTNPWGGGGFNAGNAATTSMAGDWKTGLNTILVQIKSYYTAEGFNAEVTSAALCPDPTLTVTKTGTNVTSGDNSAPLTAGDKVEYTVTAKNDAKVAFTADNPASITDDLSDVIDDATLDEGSLKATVDGQTVDAPTFDSPNLAWSGPLDAGATVTITYTVTYTGGGNSTLENTACVPDGTQTSGSNCTPPVILPAPDIDAWKTVEASSTPVQAGTTLTYTLHFENTGASAGPVNQVDDLTDVLDDATVTTEPATATGPLTATRNENKITVTGDLDAGQTSTITYTVTVNPVGERGNNQANNYLVGSTPPPTTCTPTDTQRPDCTSTPISALVPGKTVDPKSGSAVVAGQVLTYTLTFDNSKGTDDAPVTDYTDDLSKVLDDADVTTQPATTMDTLEIGAITNGSFTVNGTVPAGKIGTVTYKVTVKANGERGDNQLDNSLVHPNDPPVETHNPVRSYSVEKTASDGPVHEGGTVTYTVTVENTGAAAYTDANPATVTDDLSKVLDDATYVAGSATNGAKVSGTTLTWSGPLAVGASETITYQVKAGPAGTGDGTLTNVVTPDIDNGGSCTTPGGCKTTTLLQAFEVVKKADATEVTPGEKITYTITVTNTGKDAYTTANPASFTDDLSKVLDDATYNGDATGGATYAAPTLSWSGALAAGQVVKVTYSVTVNDPDTGDKILDNAVVTPPNIGGNCPTATTDNPDCRSLIPSGSYTVTKSADKKTVMPGEKITYTVSVENTGKADYTSEKPAAFRDDLTNVLDDATYNKDVSQGAKVDGNTLTWAGPLKVGQTVKVTYSVTVKNPETGNHILVNAVVPTVDGGGCEPEGSCMTHTPVKSFTVTKTVSTTDAVRPGTKVTYTVTVKNTGATAFTAANPASFTDDMSDVLDDATYNDDATHGATLRGTTLTWSGPLEVRQTLKVTYSVTVKAAGSGNGRLVNTVDPPVDGSCDPAGTCRTSTSITPAPPAPIVPGLAFTGTELVGPGIGLALMLLALGGGLLLVRRRRQNGDMQDNG